MNGLSFPVSISRRSMLAAPAGLLLGRRAAAAAGKVPVALIGGEDRRKNITAALEAIDGQIRPQLRRKKSVVIKPNLVSTTRQLASTHAGALRGILDYLAPRFKGPVYIAESSAGNTMEAYESFKYAEVVKEHKSQKVSLVDLNEEGLYEVIHVLNGDLHIQPVRLAARLLDPDAYVISAAILKTHNTVIATLNVKNMTLGAPLRNKRSEAKRWNDKRVYHGGVRQTHYSMTLTAQRMVKTWGVGVIDGFEGMEGNGPSMGTPVDSKLAIASTDFVAADRIGLDCMGIDPAWIGYLQWCEQTGVGKYGRDAIEVRGDTVEKLQKKYRLHGDLERQLQWMGPLTELPPKLG
jgi:uncharacterized protein (DUF362 family)